MLHTAWSMYGSCLLSSFVLTLEHKIVRLNMYIVHVYIRILNFVATSLIFYIIYDVKYK